MCALRSIRPAKKSAWNASKEQTILVTVQANYHQIVTHLTLPTAATPDTIAATVPDTVAGPAPPVLASDLTETASKGTIAPKELNSISNGQAMFSQPILTANVIERALVSDTVATPVPETVSASTATFVPKSPSNPKIHSIEPPTLAIPHIKYTPDPVRKSLLDSDRKLQVVSHAKYLLQTDCKLRCSWNHLKKTTDGNVAMSSKITADMDKFEHHINDMEPKLKLQTEACKLAEEELRVLKNVIERNRGDENKYCDTYNKMMEKIEVLKGQLVKTAKELERIKRTNSGAYDMWYRLQVENTNDWNRMLQLEQAERVARMLLRELYGIPVEFGNTEVGKTPVPEPGPFKTLLSVVYKIMDLKDFTEEEKTIVKENLVGTTFNYAEIFESENPYGLDASRKRTFPVPYDHVCTCSKKAKEEDTTEKSDDESKMVKAKIGKQLTIQKKHTKTTTIKSDSTRKFI
ncbi:hypothetical protein B9Z55_026500 [Caenorhabditis nigoni]|uniref:Uncharacterized protein n=1 Tax=Caenorhabditis nigoni TaxID=1611254 RepID=A0A2G5T3M1_9PELO|nr:hypothetical protein B9Z55_026500 [Caenorhabditis nigoni]